MGASFINALYIPPYMKYDELKEQILNMELDEKKTIYEIDEKTEIFVNKPSEIPKHLKNKDKYDPKKNFQIGLRKKGQKEFLPNHLRILMDLDIKKKENPETSEIVFEAIEKIYNGKDPKELKDELIVLHFDKEIENSYTDVCLAQLFMIEQDLNYDFGKVKPPKAYLMGYIRMIVVLYKRLI